MKRNAQIFSMIAVLMSALFIILFSGVTHVALDKKVEITKNDILRVDDFIIDLEYFIDATIDRVTYNTLQFTVSYMDTIGSYSDYESVFLSCFNKSYFDAGGSDRDCSWIIGENISFVEQIDPIIRNASKIYNISITHTWPETTFRQYDAYLVEVNTSLFFTITRPDASWVVPVERSRLVDISGVTDPATVGTPYERQIRYAPGGGDIYRAGTFDGSVAMIETFIDQGYYYRDSRGLSFIDTLEGRSLTSTDADNSFGINAFVPIRNSTGASLYRGTQTSMILYHYTSDLIFSNPDNLIRFADSTGINSSIILNKLYVLNSLEVDDTNVLLSVDGCCDATSCNPLCG